MTLLVEVGVRMFFCHLGGMLLWSAEVTGRIRTATCTDVVLEADGVEAPLASRDLDMVGEVLQEGDERKQAPGVFVKIAEEGGEVYSRCQDR